MVQEPPGPAFSFWSSPSRLPRSCPASMARSSISPCGIAGTRKEKELVAFYRCNTGDLDVASLEVVLAADDRKRAFLGLLLVGCFNHFRVGHPVFAHQKGSFHFKLLLCHNSHSRNPNTSSILPSSNPLVALPAMYPVSFTRTPVPTRPLPILIVPVPTGTFATASSRAISCAVARGCTITPLFDATPAIPTVRTPPSVIWITSTSRNSPIFDAISAGRSGCTAANGSFAMITLPAAFMVSERDITLRYFPSTLSSSSVARPETTRP